MHRLLCRKDGNRGWNDAKVKGLVPMIRIYNGGEAAVEVYET